MKLYIIESNLKIITYTNGWIVTLVPNVMCWMPILGGYYVLQNKGHNHWLPSKDEYDFNLASIYDWRLTYDLYGN